MSGPRGNFKKEKFLSFHQLSRNLRNVNCLCAPNSDKPFRQVLVTDWWLGALCQTCETWLSLCGSRAPSTSRQPQGFQGQAAQGWSEPWRGCCALGVSAASGRPTAFPDPTQGQGRQAAFLLGSVQSLWVSVRPPPEVQALTRLSGALALTSPLGAPAGRGSGWKWGSGPISPLLFFRVHLLTFACKHLPSRADVHGCLGHPSSL